MVSRDAVHRVSTLFIFVVNEIFVNNLLQLILREEAHAAFGFLLRSEVEQGGDVVYLQGAGEIFVVIHVDFVNEEGAVILLQQLVKDGSKAFARPAPVSVKIDNDGFFALIDLRGIVVIEDFFSKFLLSDGNRF